MAFVHNACPTYSIEHVVVSIYNSHGYMICYKRLQMPTLAAFAMGPAPLDPWLSSSHAYQCLLCTMHVPPTQLNTLLFVHKSLMDPRCVTKGYKHMPIAATILEHAPSNWSALTELWRAVVCLWLGKWLACTMHGPLTQSNMLLSPIYNAHGYRMCHERLQMPIPVTTIGPTPSNSSVNPD
jgi:hypothetical protein